MPAGDELLVLKSKRVKLENIVTWDMKWLAHEMNKVGVLPDNAHREVTNPRSLLTEADKATMMVSSLEKSVKSEPSNLNKFLEVIKERQVFNDAIDYLFK